MDKSKPDGTKKQLNISRLKDLGWQAKLSLEDGIKTISEYNLKKWKLKFDTKENNISILF